MNMQTDPCKVPVLCKESNSPDDARWLAMLIRRGLLVIVRGVEERYGIESWRRDRVA